MVLKWIIIILSFALFSYMVVDGSRALMIGDYMRPETGKHAGQLGPWADLVQNIGINPMSNFMKWTFVLWGGIGLFIMVSFAKGIRDSEKALLVIAALSLWYMMMGSIIAATICILTVFYMTFKRKPKPQV